MLGGLEDGGDAHAVVDEHGEDYFAGCMTRRASSNGLGFQLLKLEERAQYFWLLVGRLQNAIKMVQCLVKYSRTVKFGNRFYRMSRTRGVPIGPPFGSTVSEIVLAFSEHSSYAPIRKHPYTTARNRRQDNH